MRIFPRSQFPPHSHTILAINCVHASNWFTHLHPTRQIDGQNDNSVLSVIYIDHQSIYILQVLQAAAAAAADAFEPGSFFVVAGIWMVLIALMRFAVPLVSSHQKLQNYSVNL